jgi:hypothetical protein
MWRPPPNRNRYPIGGGLTKKNVHCLTLLMIAGISIIVCTPIVLVELWVGFWSLMTDGLVADAFPKIDV